LAIGAPPVQVFAWDGVTTGNILQVDVSQAGNLPFRVYLQGFPQLCGNGTAEGYLDDGDANYKVYVSALLMAKAMNSAVTLFANVGLYGRCRIGYIAVH
jgi:hypothetical protein